MKRKHFGIAGLLVILAAFGMLVIGCDNGNGNGATFTLSVTVAGGSSGMGSVSITSGSPTGNAEGAAVTVAAAAAANYHFVKWSNNSAGTDSVSTSNPYTFTINANTSLYAVLAPDGGGGAFVAVTNISCPQTAAIVGHDLTLSGTVEPSGATNKTIVWSGEGVSNGILNAASAGDISVTATITNGASSSSPYTKTFIIKAYNITSGVGNPFNGKKWSLTVPGDILPPSGSKVEVTSSGINWEAKIVLYDVVIKGTYTHYGTGAEWIITENPMDSTWVGDTGIAIIKEDQSLFVSNFKNVLMNGTYVPDDE